MPTGTRNISSPAGHRERLRKKLEADPLALGDQEIMELFLGLSILRRDTKPPAREVLARFGSIRGFLDARPDEVEQVPGFGSGLLSLWRLMREVLARYAAAPLLRREVLATPDAVAAVARQRLAGCPHEESWLALVDSQNRLIAWERLRTGDIDSIAIEPADVFQAALVRKASGIILVHNHPGGNPHPSKADLRLTQNLVELAPKLHLRFLDHVIVTEGDCYSISQSKILRFSGGKNGGRK